jgi:hypothetical protein
MEDSEVGVSKLITHSSRRGEGKEQSVDECKRRTNGFAFFGKIGEFSDEDVDEDFEVVGVEVLLRSGCSEKEVEDLEDEQLHAEVLGGILYEKCDRTRRKGLARGPMTMPDESNGTRKGAYLPG